MAGVDRPGNRAWNFGGESFLGQYRDQLGIPYSQGMLATARGSDTNILQ